jgi:hypothetical protein
MVSRLRSVATCGGAEVRGGSVQVGSSSELSGCEAMRCCSEWTLQVTSFGSASVTGRNGRGGRCGDVTPVRIRRVGRRRVVWLIRDARRGMDCEARQRDFAQARAAADRIESNANSYAREEEK